MAKKKNIKNIDEIDMEIIDTMMYPSLSEAQMPPEYISVREIKELGFKVDVKCKNDRQKEFLNQLKDDNKQICFGIGSPGTGKSFISLAYALKALKSRKYDTITMVIPTAPAGGKDLDLGLLKGTLQDKTEPFKDCDRETIAKILKISGNENAKFTANQLINGGYIKYEFINFLLGKTIDNSIILVNEAEQFTRENMRLILTRIGENSKFIVTGDILQTNRRSIVSKKDVNGLEFAADKLSDLDEVAITEFTDEDIVRNPLIGKILDRFDN